MPVIEYQQFIKAPVELCFDIKRSVDIHTKTTAKTKEITVDGVTEGLLEGRYCNLGSHSLWY